MRMLRLWLGFGLTHFMDSRGRYTFHHFNMLRRELNYKTVAEMLDDVRKSQSFVLLSCDVDGRILKDQRFFTSSRPHQKYNDGLTCFFSPLWHQWNGDDGEVLNGSINQGRKNETGVAESVAGSDCIYNNTLDNNTPTGGTAEAVKALAASGLGSRKSGGGELAEGALTVEQMEAAEKEEMAQRVAHARKYFRGLEGNVDAQQREPIEHILWRLKLPRKAEKGRPTGYGLTEEQAQVALHIMLDRELAVHFARDKQFMAPDRVQQPERRIYQVTNYVKRYSSEMMARSVRAMRRQWADHERREARRAQEAMLQNRPISPYEWQRPDGTRQYQDPYDGVLNIPPTAPARPSDTASWNRWTDSWYEEPPTTSTIA